MHQLKKTPTVRRMLSRMQAATASAAAHDAYDVSHAYCILTPRLAGVNVAYDTPFTQYAQPITAAAVAHGVFKMLLMSLFWLQDRRTWCK